MDLWDTVQRIVPEGKVIEIETWKYNYCRVLLMVEQRVNSYIVDIVSNQIVFCGDAMIAGSFLKIYNEGKEGLIDVQEHYNPHCYSLHQIIPCNYTKIIDDFDDVGLIRVVTDDKWGIIDGFNKTIIPIEYAHLSPIYPLIDGRYRVIAKKYPNEPEFNIYIKKNYLIDKGDWDVPLLTGEIIHTTRVE